MPIHSMQCPRCGRASTEYDQNRWRCLFCDNKFIYEPPPGEVRRDVVTKDGLFICESCKQARALDAEGALPCHACGKLTCRQCLIRDGWGNPVCRDCVDVRQSEFRQSADEMGRVSAYHFFSSIAWLAIVATTVGIPVATFKLLGPVHLFWAIPTALFALAFLFSRIFPGGGKGGGGARTKAENPLFRFPGSLFRLALIAGVPVFLAFQLAVFAGTWNLLWIVPLTTLAILVLAAAAMEI